eukprot:1359057-Amorphochlora_amoeboformis.AAC.1
MKANSYKKSIRSDDYRYKLKWFKTTALHLGVKFGEESMLIVEASYDDWVYVLTPVLAWGPSHAAEVVREVFHRVEPSHTMVLLLLRFRLTLFRRKDTEAIFSLVEEATGIGETGAEVRVEHAPNRNALAGRGLGPRNVLGARNVLGPLRMRGEATDESAVGCGAPRRGAWVRGPSAVASQKVKCASLSFCEFVVLHVRGARKS